MKASCLLARSFHSCTFSCKKQKHPEVQKHLFGGYLLQRKQTCSSHLYSTTQHEKAQLSVCKV